jgi:hypothetical protein
MWVYVWVEVAVTEPMIWVWVGHWVPIGVTRTHTQVVPEVATRSGNHYPCSPLGMPLEETARALFIRQKKS